MADAQRLNNSATKHIEFGNYDLAIASLQRALRLWEEFRLARIACINNNGSANGTIPCPRTALSCASHGCTLDGCIAFSEENQHRTIQRQNQRRHRTCNSRILFECDESSSSNNTSIDTKSRGESDSSLRNTTNYIVMGPDRGSKRRRISTHVNRYESAGNNDDDREVSCNDESVGDNRTVDSAKIYNKGNDSDDLNRNKKFKRHSTVSFTDTVDDYPRGFIYRQPIQMPQCHNMDFICFFVILFNLALANHLKLVNHQHESNGIEKATSLREVLALYELIFEYWSRTLQNYQGGATNEMSKKKNICNIGSLRFLMVLFNNMSQLYGMANMPTKQQQCLQHLLSVVMVIVESNARNQRPSAASVAAATMGVRQRHNDEPEPSSFQRSIDGFLANAMQNEQHCAEAA